MDWLKKKWPIAVIALIILVPLFFLVRFVLQGWYLNTSQIGGKIVDAKTGKPIANARLRVTWKLGTLSSSMVYKEINIKADRDGRFKIPAEHKWLHPLTPNEDQRILVYAHEYGYFRIIRKRGGKLIIEKDGELVGEKLLPGETIIKLKRLTTEEDWYDNFKFVEGLGASDKLGDCKYAIREYEIFLKKFPNNVKVPAVLLDLASIYYAPHNPCHDIKAAKQIYQRLLRDYPESEEAKAAKVAIEE